MIEGHHFSDEIAIRVITVMLIDQSPGRNTNPSEKWCRFIIG